VNPGGANPERGQPPVRRLEQVDARRVRERVRGRTGRRGRPVVLGVGPDVDDRGGVIVEAEAVHAFLAAAREP
jgi:hypothetical protein